MTLGTLTKVPWGLTQQNAMPLEDTTYVCTDVYMLYIDRGADGLHLPVLDQIFRLRSYPASAFQTGYWMTMYPQTPQAKK